MLDIEIAGSVAPRARIRVYFESFTVAGVADAVKQAEADRAAVLFTGWGQPESKWKDDDIKGMNAAFENAAVSGITVLATASDHGVTDGVKDGRRHVDFPASSPWVLSVGGTTLKSTEGHIQSEVAWKSPYGDFATGGGVSEKFARPDWQSAVPIPKRDDGNQGRGIPDVAASASPENGVSIIVDGKAQAVGGSSAAVPLWAGLVALIDQGLGYNVGYINPRLYQDIGPAGAFHAITSGDNGVDGVKGYSAGPGWTPVTGWGSPDGMKLLLWFRMHPDRGHNAPSGDIPCRLTSK